VICPKCRGKTARRSHMTGFLERGILRSIGVRAFRCEACDARFYGYRPGSSERKEETLDGARMK
jgi:hypothetical protein